MDSARGFIVIAFALVVGGALSVEAQERATGKATGGTAVPRDYPVRPVPFTAVHFTDAFWLPRIEINRTVSIPFAFEKCEESKRVYNFERAAAALRGEVLKDKTPPGYPFDDTDVYKVLEGAAYALSVHPDPKLEAYVDSLIAKIVAAQEKDGYLYTTRTIDPENPHRWAGKQRWELEKVNSHELYDLGHLYEAAVAYYQATGKRTLLDVALRSAELLDRTFGPGKQSIFPGHQIAEMGLVKLYRVTGDIRYLNLAKFLLDARGPDGSKGAGETIQPVAPAGRGTGRGGGPCRARDVHVLRDGRRRGAHRRRGLRQGARPDLGQRGGQEALRHGRHRLYELAARRSGSTMTCPT